MYGQYIRFWIEIHMYFNEHIFRGGTSLRLNSWCQHIQHLLTRAYAWHGVFSSLVHDLVIWASLTGCHRQLRPAQRALVSGGPWGLHENPSVGWNQWEFFSWSCRADSPCKMHLVCCATVWSVYSFRQVVTVVVREAMTCFLTWAFWGRPWLWRSWKEQRSLGLVIYLWLKWKNLSLRNEDMTKV